LKIYYSGTPTRRGKDISKYLNLKYIISNILFSEVNSNNFLIKLYYIIKNVIFEIQILKKLNPKYLIYEHAGDFLPTLIVLIFSRINNVKLIVDCHTCVYIDNKYNFIREYINKKVLKISKLMIAHNDETLKLSIHKNMYSLESKIPSYDKRKIKLNNKKNIVFITRFNKDEPIYEILKCTNLFSSNYQFFITGNYNNSNFLIDKKKYKNLIFTGFLPDKKYIELISSCDVHVVLTDRDFTLLYGGRESISLNKPLVISDNSSCRRYFYKGSIFVKNKSENIKKGIIKSLKLKTKLKNEMNSLKSEKLDLFHKKIKILKNKIESN
tara:strand:- start:88 stop:1062 length:975 start_codon:yes stop_codon:yes gene_type:complete